MGRLSVTHCIFNGIADIGAYEWRHECSGDIEPSSPGVAGDGAANVDDLLRLISSWGTCDPAAGEHCAADIAPAPLGDGIVDVNDLLLLITTWVRARSSDSAGQGAFELGEVRTLFDWPIRYQ